MNFKHYKKIQMMLLIIADSGLNRQQMFSLLKRMCKMPQKQSLELLEYLLKEHNSLFFQVLHKMNTKKSLVLKAVDNNKYHLAAKFMLLGCNRHVVDGSRRPFDLLTEFQKDKVSLHYTIVYNEQVSLMKESGRKWKKSECFHFGDRY